MQPSPVLPSIYKLRIVLRGMSRLIWRRLLLEQVRWVLAPGSAWRKEGPTTPIPCIAYRADGRICGEPAMILDHQRGGMVCLAHVAADVVEEITLYMKLAADEGRIDNDGEVYTWRAPAHQ